MAKDAKQENKKQEKAENLYKGLDKTEKFSEVIRRPYITEKAAMLSQSNQYVFEVLPSVNKPQIKKAVEEIYKVNVLDVNVISIPRKRKGWGKLKGFKQGMSKAIVRIKDGQKIEIFS